MKNKKVIRLIAVIFVLVFIVTTIAGAFIGMF